MIPLVSIVVPTRDRAPALAVALERLVAQEPAGACELIVVDDGSRDGTPGLLAAREEQGALRVLRSAGQGPGAARNLGIAAARAPIVACTDDDCEVPPDWAARLRSRVLGTGAAAVGGRVVAAPGTPLAGRLSQAITNGVAAAFAAAGGTFITSNNVAYRKDALLDAGGFSAAYPCAAGEERDLHARLLARGEHLFADASIVVQHRQRLRLPGLFAQQVGHGRAARRFYATQGRVGLDIRGYGRAYRAALLDAEPRDRTALVFAWPMAQAAVAWGYWSPGAPPEPSLSVPSA